MKRMRKAVLCGLAMTVAVTLSAGAVAAVAESENALSIGQSVSVEDEAFLYENSGSSVGDNGGVKHRFADNGNYFTYKVAIGDEDENNVYAELKMYNSPNRSVEISSDNSGWEEVHYSGYEADFVTYSREGDYCTLKIALADFIGAGGFSYVKICAHDKNAGNGGDLYSIAFVSYNAPEIVVENGKSIAVNVGDSSLLYGVSGTGTGVSNGTTHRFADGTDYFAYKVKFNNATKNGKFIKIFYKGTNRALYASADGDNYALLGCSGATDEAAYKTGNDVRGYYCFYAIGNHLSESGEVYVKFGAENTASGNGADVFFLSFLDGYENENFGQSTKQAIDLTGDSMISAVSAEDAGSIYRNEGAGLLPYDNKFALSAKNEDSFVYRVKLPRNADSARAYIRIETRGDKNLIEASKNDDSYEPMSAAVSYGNVSFYSLAAYVGGNEYVYLRFSSSEKKADGGESFLLSLSAYCGIKLENQTPEIGKNEIEKTYSIGAAEKPVGGDEGGIDNGWRYFDDVKYGVYKFEYDKNATSIFLDVKIKNGYLVSASQDGIKWKDVALGDVKYVRGGVDVPEENISVNLTDAFADEAKSGELYVKIADATPADGGWGGSFEEITLKTVTKYVFSAEATLELDDLTHVNFYFCVTPATAVEKYGVYLSSVKFSDGEAEGAIEKEAIQNGEKYMVQTDGIAAKEIGDSVWAQMYAVIDGKTMKSEAFEYSPKIYAMNKLNGGNVSDETKDLCLALLDYGAAAQTYFGYKTDALANGEVSEETRAAVEEYRSTVYAEKQTYEKASFSFDYSVEMSLTLEGAIALNCYVTAPDAEKVQIAVFDKLPDETEIANAGRIDLTALTDEKFLYTAEKSFSAKEIGNGRYYVIYVTAKGEERVSPAIAYGGITYAMNKISSGTASEKIKNLCKAMLDYGAAAQKYFKYNTENLANRYI